MVMINEDKGGDIFIERWLLKRIRGYGGIYEKIIYMIKREIIYMIMYDMIMRLYNESLKIQKG